MQQCGRAATAQSTKHYTITMSQITFSSLEHRPSDRQHQLAD